MCAARPDGAGDDVAGLELTEAVECPQRRPSGQDEDQLLVRVVEVEGRAVVAGIDLVQRRAEPLGTGLRADPGGSSPERRLVALDPVRLEDVRHGREPSNHAARRAAACQRSCFGTTKPASFAWPGASPLQTPLAIASVASAAVGNFASSRWRPRPPDARSSASSWTPGLWPISITEATVSGRARSRASSSSAEAP